MCVRFFFSLLSSPPRPPGVLQANALLTSLSLRSLESWWPGRVLRHCPLRSSPPRHHSRDCVLKAPGELPFLLRALRARPLS